MERMTFSRLSVKYNCLMIPFWENGTVMPNQVKVICRLESNDQLAPFKGHAGGYLTSEVKFPRPQGDHVT